MIKQFIMSIEASDEQMIDNFILLMNQQCKATENVSPIKIHIEDK